MFRRTSGWASFEPALDDPQNRDPTESYPADKAQVGTFPGDTSKKCGHRSATNQNHKHM